MKNIITKTLLLLSTLLALSNCRGMTPEYFAKKKPYETTIVFNVRFNYSGKERKLSNAYNAFFNDGKSKFGGGINYKIHSTDNGDNYVFMNTDADSIFLNAMQGMQYRVFYNKYRIRFVEQKLLSNPRSNKIAYGGDIEITWVPEIFRFYDLTYLGHMGLQDNGSFIWGVKDRYKQYLNFMKSEYGYDASRSINAVDYSLAGRILK